MQIIDLSHEIHEQMTVFGEMEKPKINRKYSIKKDGFNLHEISMSSHTGTHVDAPVHMVQSKKYLDDFDLNQFYGQALMLKVERFAEGEIPLSFLKNYESEIEEVDFLVLNSGWYKNGKQLNIIQNSLYYRKNQQNGLHNLNLKG